MSLKTLMITSVVSIGTLANSASGSSTIEDVCEYRLSTLVGKGASGAIATAALTGAATKAAGFYSLTHASSGLYMLGSTLAGASNAGTIGIIAGTGGAIGTIGAFLLAPITIVVGGLTAVGIGGFEAACYFNDERITDYDEILGFMQHLALHHPEDRFQLVEGLVGREDDAIKIWNPETEVLDRYMISDLYIVNGKLMQRKWGPNRNLGFIAYVSAQDMKRAD